MNTIKYEHQLGNIRLLYLTNENARFGGNLVGFTMVPADMDLPFAEKQEAIEPLVQLHIRGDMISGSFANGHTMSSSASNMGFECLGQEVTEDQIITILKDAKGREIRHIVTYNEAWEAITVKAQFTNGGNEALTLENLTSFCLSGMTPYEPGDAVGTMSRHYFRSAWSAEGRLVSDTIESINMEPSWSTHGFRIEKIGQVGSMPVRSYFPFEAVTDDKNGVTWAAHLAINSSWQLELKRRDDGLILMGGMADYDFGHWAKTIAPGETFTTPEAYLTVVKGDLTDATQSLLTIQKTRNVMQPETLPLLFNEYCTTWGVPSDENITKIIASLKGKGFDYLVMDSGWYLRENDPESIWFNSNGDWVVKESMFPNGMGGLVDKIHAAGMKAGIWFEFENSGVRADVSKKTDWFLHRDGYLLSIMGKTFFDMRKPEVQAYMRERVTGLLQKYNFDYIKVDYNDSIGVGVDGAESLGEGLRQNMEASKAFFRSMKADIPHLMIENCSSGGHRIEPSMMEVATMASFSDAHECPEIPVIAANLHHLCLPGQSQIWAVMRGTDSMTRITYSLTAAMLGVMCLSGDIYDLDEAQWEQINKGTSFYKKVTPIIRDGKSRIYRQGVSSWRHLDGCQAVVRTADTEDQILVIAHNFENKAASEIRIPMCASFKVADQYTDGTVTVAQEGDELVITMSENFSGAAVLLKK